MRRNDVVYVESEAPYTFYGRIVRVVGDKALWINVKGEIYFSLLSDLVKIDYQGRWEDGYYIDEYGYNVKYYYHKDKETIWDHSVLGDPKPVNPKFVRRLRFIWMPSLRKLKQRAGHWHGKNAWRTPLDYDDFWNKEGRYAEG